MRVAGQAALPAELQSSQSNEDIKGFIEAVFNRNDARHRVGLAVVPGYIEEPTDVLGARLISISTTAALRFLAAKQSLSCPVRSAKAPN